MESAPTSRFPASERELLKGTQLFEWCFVHPGEFCPDGEPDGFLVLGAMTLCNHSNEPTAHVCWNVSDLGFWVELKSISQLTPGEEVTLKYTDIDEYGSAVSFV